MHATLANNKRTEIYIIAPTAAVAAAAAATIAPTPNAIVLFNFGLDNGCRSLKHAQTHIHSLLPIQNDSKIEKSLKVIAITI